MTGDAERILIEGGRLEVGRLLTLVLDCIPRRVFWKDCNLVFQGCNPAFARDAGLPSPEAIVGKTDLDMPWAERAEAYRADDRAVIESGQPKIDYEESQTTPEGRTIWLRTSKVPLLDASGQVHGVMGTYEDITGYKTAVEALEQSEKRLRALIENVPVGVYRSTAGGQILEANPALCAMLGFESMAELREANIARDFYVDPERRREALQKLERDGELRNMELHLKRKDGRAITVLENCRTVYDDPGGEPCYEGMLVDITERKRAEQSLRREQEFTERVIDAVPGVFFVIDRRGRYVRWNKAQETLIGMPPERIREIAAMSRIHEEDRARVAGKMEEALVHGTAEVEARGIVGAGPETRDFLMTGRRLEVDGELFIVGCGVDITERKNAEAAQAKLEARLIESQKLESLGRLAGGVAHDFNNLLTVINGYSDMALRGLKKDHVLKSPLTEIRNAGERAAELTQQLLAFSRKQVIRLNPLNLSDSVSEARPMLEHLMGEDIELVTRLDPSLGHVLADPGQIRQVLLNLALNARDAMPEGGTLSIETANVHLDEVSAAAHPEMKPGAYALLSVGDTGPGMDAATREHIFEPFFTTRSGGSGAGLGLSTVYGVVKQCGGWIGADSEPGRGTTFRIYLPRIEAPGVSRRPVEREIRSLRGSETILVVEDQQEVLKLVVEVLSNSGYRILEAAAGEEALLLAERHTGQIHLMLTDVVMPRITGKALAERLKPLRPETKVLYMSGYTGDVIARQGLLDQGLNYIQKPFAPDALLTRVRQILDLRRAGSILVVDDEENIRNLFKGVLTAAGYEVSLAGNGSEALKMVRERVADPARARTLFRRLPKDGGTPAAETGHREKELAAESKTAFQLMILDLSMPDIDGFEVLKLVRTELPQLKIIVVSGFLEGPVLKMAELFGAAATLEKPVAPDSLVSAVRDALGQTAS